MRIVLYARKAELPEARALKEKLERIGIGKIDVVCMELDRNE